MFKKFSLLIVSLLCVVFVRGHEGMWLPILLDMDDMQRNGLKLSAEDIYSINQASLKDAIVHFGGGCTAEAISDQGLILTNHHCGYSAIQNLSSVENDYLGEGFWAGSMQEEMHCPGLTASFVDRIEDVTEQVLEGIDDSTPPEERQLTIKQRIAELTEAAVDHPAYKAQIKPFYYGNQYIMIVTKTYDDVRLVGTPPSSIGKFGGDSDNWVWPRHTGDFALFRIYADEDNQPVAFAETNQPYEPARSLEISIAGVKEGDFTMVYGFPGVTDQYMTSEGVQYVTEIANPLRIGMREQSLEVIDALMAESDEKRIQFAARQAMISNAHKKWIGQNMGLDRFDALNKKREAEAAFIEKAEAVGNDAYVSVIPKINELHHQIRPYQLARDLFIEVYFYGPQILSFTRRLDPLIAAIEQEEDQEKINELEEKAVQAVNNFYENYDPAIDEIILSRLLTSYTQAVREDIQPDALQPFHNKFNGDAKRYSNHLFSKSVYKDKSSLLSMIQARNKKRTLKLKNDPIHALALSFMEDYRIKILPEYSRLTDEIDDNMRVYMKGLMELNPEKTYWSEANSTLRVTYGKVEGSIPRDGLSYLSTTTLEGVMHKYIPGDREYDVPEKLIELYELDDYGRYASEDGTLAVNFLASNHTTGGNSGSPVLNDRGQLIGINFDRSWESTMSDIMFNPDICRNISVDVRYILFIVDKFAGAGWLLDEMKITEN